MTNIIRSIKNQTITKRSSLLVLYVDVFEQIKYGLGEVEGLRREVTQAVCQISTPQGIDTLVLHGSHGAVNDAFIGLIQAALTDHLILILDEQLDTLDRSGGRLRCNGGYAGQGEVLRESQLEVTHFGQFLYNL